MIPAVGRGPPQILSPLHFIRRSFAVLSRLVDYRGREQSDRIKIADSETVQPRLVPAGHAVKLGPPYVPQLDVDAIRTALAEDQGSHDVEV